MLKTHFKNKLGLILLLPILTCCVSNKDILYFQDANNYKETNINYIETTIQPNDILSINVSATFPETAIPYNRNTASNNAMVNQNIDALRLQGYLVNTDGYISLPILGKVLAKGKTIFQLESDIIKKLEGNGHLKEPGVLVRILNAKVTVLGEVNQPGTFSFTEQYVSVPQALGYAGDLTINGRRDDVLLIREVDGKRTISHIDLTSMGWFKNSEYIIKPNDVIVVQPNEARIKTAGYVGNVSTIVSIASLLLSATILITR